MTFHANSGLGLFLEIGVFPLDIALFPNDIVASDFVGKWGDEESWWKLGVWRTLFQPGD